MKLQTFEDLGYFKEYYINGKYIGSIRCKKDREVMGYYGSANEVTNDLILLDNKKRIKPGVIVRTILYNLCGKKI